MRVILTKPHGVIICKNEPHRRKQRGIIGVTEVRTAEPQELNPSNY
jgi:hypothetical protein